MYGWEAMDGLGKSPLDTFNTVDKILSVGIPYQRAVFENGSYLSTKRSYQNDFFLFLAVKEESIIWEIVAAFLIMLSMCLSKWREESIKIPKSLSWFTSFFYYLFHKHFYSVPVQQAPVSHPPTITSTPAPSSTVSLAPTSSAASPMNHDNDFVSSAGKKFFSCSSTFYLVLFYS